MGSTRRTSRSFRPAVVLVVLIAASSAAGLLTGAPASASQASVNVEQDWELLSETAPNIIAPTTLKLPRGVIPGGTTKFAPQPTATLHVVGKVTTSSSTAAGWDVRVLSSTGSVLGSVRFQASASTSFRIPTPTTVTWPAADTAIDRIMMEPYGTVGLQGTFHLQKAYLRIRQTGIITKTVGRLHMGGRNSGVTATEWGKIVDPAIYVHDASGFSPAPTVRLRATAFADVCDIAVSLYDVTGEQTVPGSVLYFDSIASEYSNALSLVDGHTYLVRRKVIGGCQSPPTRSDSMPEDPAAGDFISADLEFEQQTADAAGLVRTTGWYAGVTAPADASNERNLDYLFTAPNNIFPKDPQETGSPKSHDPRWSYVAYRRATPGSNPTVSGELQDRNNLTSGSTATSSTGVQSEEPTLQTAPFLSQSAISNISPGDYLDTRVVLSGEPLTPRISWSAMRQAIQLKDAYAPVIGSLTPSVDVFSPANQDGFRDVVTYSASASDYSPVSWTVTVKNSTGDAVRTSGLLSGGSLTW